MLSAWKLAASLKNRDWRTVARKYNGPNALKNGYDKKLKAAFEKFSSLAARAVATPGKNWRFCLSEWVLALQRTSPSSVVLMTDGGCAVVPQIPHYLKGAQASDRPLWLFRRPYPDN